MWYHTGARLRARNVPMNQPTPASSPADRTRFPAPWLVVGAAVAVSATFLILTPPGWLTKADMVGYAVCHRIESHSFEFGGRQLPLCARCTGTFVGALLGLVGQCAILKRSRAGEFPPTPIIALLVLFIAAMGADGLNSYLTFFPNLPHLYEPRNWLRLTTGALSGLALSGLLYPILNATLWNAPQATRAIARWRDLGVLLLLEAGLVGAVLTGWAPLLVPLATLSALGVLAMLTSVNTVILVMLAGRENTASHWRDTLLPLLAGLTLSLLEIGAVDALRYWLTGTLGGLPLSR